MTLTYTLSKTILGHSFFNHILVLEVCMNKILIQVLLPLMLLGKVLVLSISLTLVALAMRMVFSIVHIIPLLIVITRIMLVLSVKVLIYSGFHLIGLLLIGYPGCCYLVTTCLQGCDKVATT